MLCPGNHTCRFIPPALMYTATESNPLCTTGCCPADCHPGGAQRGRAGPCRRGYRFRPNPAAAIHDDAAARASETRQASRRVHPRRAHACADTFGPSRCCWRRRRRNARRLLGPSGAGRLAARFSLRAASLLEADTRRLEAVFPAGLAEDGGTRETNQRTNRRLRKRPPSGRLGPGTARTVATKQRVRLAGHGAARRGKPAKPAPASSVSRGVDPKPSWRCFQKLQRNIR